MASLQGTAGWRADLFGRILSAGSKGARQGEVEGQVLCVLQLKGKSPSLTCMVLFLNESDFDHHIF